MGDHEVNTFQIAHAPGEAPRTMQWWAIAGELDDGRPQAALL
jgi:hypothetical protein